MTTSYWQNRSPRDLSPRRREIDLNKTWDIAVIGGGICGVGTAYFLKKFGCERVIVLEKNYVGYGASGRNAGFILSGLAEPYSRLIVGMGADSAKRITQSTMENHDLIAAAVTEKRIDCHYSRCGSYHLAVTEVERAELEESAGMMQKDGFPVEYREKSEITGKEGSSAYLGGFFNASDGKIDPFAFVNGLSEGIEVVEGFEVKKISKAGGSVEISGEKEVIKAEMAVIAVNGYSPLLDRYFENLVFPVRGQMLATSPIPNDILGNFTYYANFGYDYFRQLEDKGLIMGGLRNRFFADEVGYEDETSPDLQKGLETYIGDNFAQNDFQVRNRWGGVMGNTIDGLPLVGALPHNSSVLAAVGFNGHGFGMGMVTARDLARAIMYNESSELLKRFSLKRLAK